MRGRGIRDQTSYRERLSPSLWTLVAAALTGPMAALVVVPLDATASLLVGAVVGAGFVAALVASSPVIEVSDGVLRAGRARIGVEYLGEAVASVGEEARQARGPGLDPRSFHLLRGGIDGVVVVRIEDADDPAPAWALSSRTPERVVAALSREKIRLRTPRR